MSLETDFLKEDESPPSGSSVTNNLSGIEVFKKIISRKKKIKKETKPLKD